MTEGKRALITGITGQDGSYLAELLLSKGYEVHGVIRRSSSFNTQRIDAIYQDPHEPDRRLILHYGDLNDASSLNRILRIVAPHEIYNLGAQSHVKVSFDTPEYTGEVTGLGATVCVLGLSYKPDIDDDRESPSFEIIELLQERGAVVSYCDPFIPAARKGRKHDLDLRSVPCTAEELSKYDAVLVATPHSAFKDQALYRNAKLVIDTRNVVEARPDGPPVTRA